VKRYISFLLSFFIIAVLFNSCSVKVKEEDFKKLTCEDKFKQILEYSKKDYTQAKAKGRLIADGITLTFIGSLGNEWNFNFYLPFGKKILSLKANDNNLCVNYQGRKICEKEKIFYKKVLRIDIPFSFKELISGKYQISPNANYKCVGNKVIINDKNAQFVYEYLKPTTVKYKDYLIKYTYRPDLLPKEINVFQGSTRRLKITIEKVKK